MLKNNFKIILILLSSYYCSGDRVKRVLHGMRVVGRKGPYDAVRYLVGIGTVHGSTFWTLGFWDFLKHTGLYGSVNCGGSLLTPSVVQTACHCVSVFSKDPTERAPRINHHWEDVRVVYIGINDRFGKPFSWLTRSPVHSHKFFVSKGCQKVPHPNTTPDDLSYDFGLITMDPSWIKGDSQVPTTNVKFTPIYKIDELRRIHQLFLMNPPVCLNVGFGAFDDEEHTSDFIRSGWVHLMDDYRCRRFTGRYLDTPEKIARYKTWDCSDNFPKFLQPAREGDSGSPFTCNNAYFGVQGGYVTFKKGTEYENYSVSTTEALVHSVYENTIEYRKSFEEQIIQLSKVTYVDIVRGILKHYFPFPVLRRIENTKPTPIPTSRLFSYGTSMIHSFSYLHVPSFHLALSLNILLLF